jgi:hypothetical protein
MRAVTPLMLGINRPLRSDDKSQQFMLAKTRIADFFLKKIIVISK